MDGRKNIRKIKVILEKNRHYYAEDDGNRICLDPPDSLSVAAVTFYENQVTATVKRVFREILDQMKHDVDAIDADRESEGAVKPTSEIEIRSLKARQKWRCVVERRISSMSVSSFSTLQTSSSQATLFPINEDVISLASELLATENSESDEEWFDALGPADLEPKDEEGKDMYDYFREFSSMVQWNFFRQFVRQMYEDFIPVEERKQYEAEKLPETKKQPQQWQFQSQVEQKPLAFEEEISEVEIVSVIGEDETTLQNSEEECPDEITARTSDFECCDIITKKSQREVSTQFVAGGESTVEVYPLDDEKRETTSSTVEDGQTSVITKLETRESAALLPRMTVSEPAFDYGSKKLEESESIAHSSEEMKPKPIPSKHELLPHEQILIPIEQGRTCKSKEDVSAVEVPPAVFAQVEGDPSFEDKGYRADTESNGSEGEAEENTTFFDYPKQMDLDTIEGISDHQREKQDKKETGESKIPQDTASPRSSESEDTNRSSSYSIISEPDEADSCAVCARRLEETDMKVTTFFAEDSEFLESECTTKLDTIPEESGGEDENEEISMEDEAILEEELEESSPDEEGFTNEEYPNEEEEQAEEEEVVDDEGLIEDEFGEEEEVVMGELFNAEEFLEEEILEEEHIRQNPGISKDYEPMPTTYRIPDDQDLMFAVPPAGNQIPMDALKRSTPTDEDLQTEQKPKEESESLSDAISQSGKSIPSDRGNSKLEDGRIEEDDNLIFAIPPTGKSIPLDREISEESTSQVVPEPVILDTKNEEESLFYAVPPPGKSIPMDREISKEKDVEENVFCTVPAEEKSISVDNKVEGGGLFYAVPPPGKCIPLEGEILINGNISDIIPSPRKSGPLDVESLKSDQDITAKKIVTEQSDTDVEECQEQQNVGEVEEKAALLSTGEMDIPAAELAIPATSSTPVAPIIPGADVNLRFPPYLSPPGLPFIGHEGLPPYSGLGNSPYSGISNIGYPGLGYPYPAMGTIPILGVPGLYPGVSNLPPGFGGLGYAAGTGSNLPFNIPIGTQIQQSIKESENQIGISEDAKIISITPKTSTALKIGEHVVYINYEPSVYSLKESKSAAVISTQTEPAKCEMATQYDLEEDIPQGIEVQIAFTEKVEAQTMSSFPELDLCQERCVFGYRPELTDVDEITETGEDLSNSDVQSLVRKSSEKWAAVKTAKIARQKLLPDTGSPTDPSISTESDSGADNSSISLSSKISTPRHKAVLSGSPVWKSGSLEAVVKDTARNQLLGDSYRSMSAEAILSRDFRNLRASETSLIPLKHISECTKKNIIIRETTTGERSCDLLPEDRPKVSTTEISRIPLESKERPTVSTGAIPKVRKDNLERRTASTSAIPKKRKEKSKPPTSGFPKIMKSPAQKKTAKERERYKREQHKREQQFKEYQELKRSRMLDVEKKNAKHGNKEYDNDFWNF